MNDPTHSSNCTGSQISPSHDIFCVTQDWSKPKISDHFISHERTHVVKFFEIFPCTFEGISPFLNHSWKIRFSLLDTIQDTFEFGNSVTRFDDVSTCNNRFHIFEPTISFCFVPGSKDKILDNFTCRDSVEPTENQNCFEDSQFY